MQSEDQVKQALGRIIKQRLAAEKRDDTLVHYGGRCFHEEEILAGIDALLELWLTHGPRTQAFERQFADTFGAQYCLAVNSGSSANLVALSAITSPRYSRRLPKQAVVATPALTFPTTVAPLYYNNLVPCYIDIEPDTLNLSVDSLAAALNRYPVQAVVLPHFLGNATDMDKLLDLVRTHNLLLVEDACEAMGAHWNGRALGTLGHIGTFSLYASHHITSGEGGMILCNNEELRNIMTSLRDWGRAYPLPTHRAGMLQDFRYVYTELGFNVKQNEIFSSIGSVQLRRLADFIRQRQAHFDYLQQALTRYRCFVPVKSYAALSTGWFGFPIIVKKDAPFRAGALKAFLENNRVETRSMMAGNITRQPAFRKRKYVRTDLTYTDFIANHAFFIGIHPGLTENNLQYVTQLINRFVS